MNARECAAGYRIGLGARSAGCDWSPAWSDYHRPSSCGNEFSGDAGRLPLLTPGVLVRTHRKTS